MSVRSIVRHSITLPVAPRELLPLDRCVGVLPVIAADQAAANPAQLPAMAAAQAARDGVEDDGAAAQPPAMAAARSARYGVTGNGATGGATVGRSPVQGICGCAGLLMVFVKGGMALSPPRELLALCK